MNLSTQTKFASLADRANRVVVRHRLGDVVCVIEITSPGNKTSKQKMQEFVGKVIGYLQAGVNLLIVDLLPSSKRDPEGIHKAIWDDVASADIEEDRPAGKPLTLAAYVPGDALIDHSVRAFVNYVSVGDSLPDMAAYLDDDSYVPVPLEATYTKAWNSCPADMRYLVEHGKLPED